MKLRLLSQKDIRQALTLPRAIELMEQAFRSLSKSEVEVPIRTSIRNERGTMLYKPSMLPASNSFGIKVVSVFPAILRKTFLLPLD